MIILLSILLLAAAIIDLKTQRIPNYLTLSGILAALAYHFSSDGFNGLLFSLLGIVVGIGLLIIPYLMEGMGAGDAKLMGVVGGFLGAKGAFSAFLVIALVGGVYALILRLIYKDELKGFSEKLYHEVLSFILTRKFVPNAADATLDKPKLCYGLAIALGTFLYIALNTLGYSIL
jgi:prepilin peptidase CpaA